jgi:ketosteroid isomerase-like protein
MSEENVATYRQSLDAFDRRDRAAYLALCDPDFEVVPDHAWPEAGAIRGREAAWDFYVKVTESFERFDSDDAEVTHAGADTVLAHRRRELRGGASGADVEFNYWTLTIFREGKMLRDQWFADRAEALKAAGLSE